MNLRTTLLCSLLLGILGAMIGGWMAGAILNQPLRDQLTKSCASSEEVTKAAQSARDLQFGMESNKRMLEIQTKIVDACIAKGGIPILNGGQVDCRESFAKGK
jgi:hypothetical protein